MEIFEQNDDLCSVHFDSVMELLDYEGGRKNGAGFKKRLTAHSEISWYGTCTSAEEVVNKALLGDSELLEDLQEKVKMLSQRVGAETQDYVQRVATVKRRRVNREFGDELDIHKIYQGKADQAWRTTVREEVDAEHHLVTLLVDLSDDCGVDARNSLWRAAATYKLVSDLENAGKSVKVLVGSLTHGAYYGSQKCLTTSIVVKEYGQQLPYDRLAAMAHLGFFRTFCFAAFYAQEEYKPVKNLGYPMTLGPKMMPLQLRPEIEAGHTKYVVVGRAKSLEGAVASLESAYKQMKDFS